METEKETAREAVDSYFKQLPKDWPSGWLAPIISTIGFPERISHSVRFCCDSISITHLDRMLDYSREHQDS